VLPAPWAPLVASVKLARQARRVYRARLAQTVPQAPRAQLAQPAPLVRRAAPGRRVYAEPLALKAQRARKALQGPSAKLA
jgi:hypothetical protein